MKIVTKSKCWTANILAILSVTSLFVDPNITDVARIFMNGIYLYIVCLYEWYLSIYSVP